jgi:ribosomal-protein-alanine N-acetyltransferase
MNVTVEDATIRHLDRLYEIETQCFEKEAFTKKQITQLLTEYNAISLIAKVDSEIAGFVIGRASVDRNALNGHILTLDVSPRHRRKGVGKKLLEEIERIFKEKGAEACYLEVREGNAAALSLYLKFEYKKIGKLRNYYGNAHGTYLKKTLA